VDKEVAVDGSGFGHAHLGAADKRGNVRGIDVAVANETAAGPRLVYCGPKSPTPLFGITKLLCGLS